MSQAQQAAATSFPRVPAYAWSWLQRSRPVLVEAAQRLTGAPPAPGFVDELRDLFETDPFTRDILIGVIADVAFGGRVPRYRPAGASWDRGLTWWAAAIAGTSAGEFEARTAQQVHQRRLFETDDDAGAPTAATARRRRAPTAERTMLVQALQQLLRSADGDVIPVSAVRQLLATLDEGDRDRPGQ